MRKLKYHNNLVPVYIKYDFISESYETKTQKDWIECRWNLKPSETSIREIEMYCNPVHFFKLSPYFTLCVNAENLRCNLVACRSKLNVYGLFWTFAKKSCCILIAFDNNLTREQYGNYLKGILPHCQSLDNIIMDEKDAIEDVPSLEVSHANSENSMEVNTKGRRRFFSTSLNNSNESTLSSQARKRISRITTLFKKKRREENNISSCQEFMEPSKIERDWYELNQNEMDTIENRMVNMLKALSLSTGLNEIHIDGICNNLKMHKKIKKMHKKLQKTHSKFGQIHGTATKKRSNIWRKFIPRIRTRFNLK